MSERLMGGLFIYFFGVVVGLCASLFILWAVTDEVDYTVPTEVAEEADRRAEAVEYDCDRLWAETEALEAQVLLTWPHLTESDAEQYIGESVLFFSPEGLYMTTLAYCYGGER